MQHTYTSKVPFPSPYTPFQSIILSIIIRLYRQLNITPPPSQRLQPRPNIRPHNRNISRKLPNRNQKITKQNKQPVQLNQEARERPAQEDEENAGDEGGGPFELLAAGEEGESFFEADY